MAPHEVAGISSTHGLPYANYLVANSNVQSIACVVTFSLPGHNFPHSVSLGCHDQIPSSHHGLQHSAQ